MSVLTVFFNCNTSRTFCHKAGKGAQRIDVDGERAELAEVLDEVRCFAMFGGQKVVVVQNADAFITKYREQLENYVAKPSDSATLVFRLSSLPANQRIYKAISKTGVIEKCDPPKDLARWIIDRGKLGASIDGPTGCCAPAGRLCG